MKIPGLVQKRGWWYFRPPQVGGVESRRIALRTRDHEKAAADVWEMQKNGTLFAVGAGTVEGLIPRYLADRRDQRKQNAKSRHNTNQVLCSFARWAGNPAVTRIDRQMVEDWRASMAALSDASVTSYLQRLRGFLTWCCESGIIARHPMRGVRLSRPRATRLHRWLTIEERERMLAVTQLEWTDKKGRKYRRPVSADMRLFLHLGFFAGLRPGEIVAARWEWIQGGRLVVGEVKLDGKVVFLPKDKEARAIPIHPRLAAILEEHRRPEGWIIAPDSQHVPTAPKLRYDPKKAFAGVCDAAKVAATPYTLRHSFGAHLVQAGATLAQVAALLGDSLSVTEAHYAGLGDADHGVVSLLG